MQNPPLVYIVMLVHNNCEHTLRAIESLQAMTYPNYTLLVVDNQSTDDTVPILRQRYPALELIVNERNLGFAAGTNVGIEAALARGAGFVLCINNDVLVEPAMLERLVGSMAPEIGAASPLIYDLEEPERVWSSGYTRHPLVMKSSGGNRGQTDPGDWPEHIEVDYLDGCAMLLPRAVLQRVGVFDSSYFFYYEDRDLSYRLQRAGYRLITVPAARMWHEGAASTGTDTPFQVYQQARSSVIYFRRNTRGWQRPASFLFRLGSGIKKSARFLLRGQPRLLTAHWRGILDGWQVAAQPQKQRLS